MEKDKAAGLMFNILVTGLIVSWEKDLYAETIENNDAESSVLSQQPYNGYIQLPPFDNNLVESTYSAPIINEDHTKSIAIRSLAPDSSDATTTDTQDTQRWPSFLDALKALAYKLRLEGRTGVLMK